MDLPAFNKVLVLSVHTGSTPLSWPRRNFRSPGALDPRHSWNLEGSFARRRPGRRRRFLPPVARRPLRAPTSGRASASLEPEAARRPGPRAPLASGAGAGRPGRGHCQWAPLSSGLAGPGSDLGVRPGRAAGDVAGRPRRPFHPSSAVRVGLPQCQPECPGRPLRLGS
jgi:hypothetical protein